MSLIQRITNYLLVRRFEGYIGNSLNRYLDVLNIMRELLEDNGDRNEELERKISEVADAIKRNDVMTHKGKLLIPDGLNLEAIE
jgi:hypothetical protein